MPEDNETSDLSDFEDYVNPKQVDRKRGILTKKDREYLVGERELEGQDERNTRYRIRQRIIQSLIDIQLLMVSSIEDELKQVANSDEIAVAPVSNSLAEMAYGLHVHNQTVSDPKEKFKSDIKSAILRYESPPEDSDNMPYSIDATVDIDVAHSKIDTVGIEEEIREGTASPEQLLVYLSSDDEEELELEKEAQSQLSETLPQLIGPNSPAIRNLPEDH